MDKKTKKRVSIFFRVFLPAFFIFAFARGACAATLSLFPSSGNFIAGQSFTVSVNVSSEDQAMNAAQGEIAFPIDTLEVVSLSTANSVMALWVQPPSFSNYDGVVNFQGVAVNPGFEGSSAQVLTITFRAKKSGPAALSFTSGSVLANDGQGTNILSAMEPASFTIVPAGTGSSVAAAGGIASDRTPPAPFSITQIADNPNDPTDPQPIFRWATTDFGSGMDHYALKIGDGDWFNAATIRIPTSTHEYQLPLQSPASDILLTVDAYDKAGNVSEATTSFSVAAIPSPVVTDYSKQVFAPQQVFQVKGTTEKGALVKVYLQNGNAENVLTFVARADQSGNWAASGGISEGTGSWIMTAQAADTRGALSDFSPALPVDVGSWFNQAIAFLLGWSGVILAAIMLLALLAFIIYALEHRFLLWRLGFNRELLNVRKELSEDLTRIDKEFEGSTPSNSANVNPAAVEKSRADIRREVAHIEADIKKELQRLDDIEKMRQ